MSIFRSPLARAKVAQSEAEKLIGIAIRGATDAQAHLRSVVDDDYTAEQLLELARRGRFSLDEKIPTNEERADQGKFPLSAEARKLKEDRLAGLQKDLLSLIKDRDEAQLALTTAREALAIELHARRMILKRLPRETDGAQDLRAVSCRAMSGGTAAIPASPSWATGKATRRRSPGSRWSSAVSMPAFCGARRL